MADYALLPIRVYAAAYQTLIGAVRVVGLQEGGREDAPAAEGVYVERTALLQQHLRTPSVLRHFQGVRHYQREGEGRGYGRVEGIVAAVDQHVGTGLARLYGHRIGLETVMEGLDCIAAGVDNLHSEGPVIVAADRGHHRHAEILHVLLDRIDIQGVGEHHIFAGLVEIALLRTGGPQCEACRKGGKGIYILFHLHTHLLLSFGWISEPGASSSLRGIGHTKRGLSASTLSDPPSSTQQLWLLLSKPRCQRLRSCRRKPSI